MQYPRATAKAVGPLLRRRSSVHLLSTPPIILFYLAVSL